MNSDKVKRIFMDWANGNVDITNPEEVKENVHLFLKEAQRISTEE